MSRKESADRIFRLPPSPKSLKNSWSFPLKRCVEYLLALNKCRQMYAQLPECRPDDFCSHALNALAVDTKISPEDRARIPAQGPLIVVANHPFGAIDGLVLLNLLQQIRSDVRILANFLLQRIPELRPYLISVDPFGGTQSKVKNISGLRESLRWLEQGGVLVIFPAGEVSHLKLSQATVSDPPWSNNLARLVRSTSAPVLPIYFPGRNSLIFQCAGMLHPTLRTALLPHELVNKKNRSIEVRIGRPIANRHLQKMPNAEMSTYLRARTYLLHKRSNHAPLSPSISTGIPIISPLATELLEQDVRQISAHQRLLESGPYQVFHAAATQIPNILKEIGRLREWTFRGVGEGTGREMDLDRFDEHYTHLFIWQNESKEIVGAYRLGCSDEILTKYGIKGLYTSTLFHYRARFLNELGPALEMGRSFVRPEYQKSYNPLMLLWKGIGRFVVQHPKYAVLFGPVSISREYQSASRHLIAESLSTFCSLPDMARLVKARRPLRLKKTPFRERVDPCGHYLSADFDEIDLAVSHLENDGKGVPVLLRQYLNLGGKVLAFNIDKEFSDVLDGLILVDLRNTELKTLERYCGRAGAADFLDYHAQRDMAQGFYS